LKMNSKRPCSQANTRAVVIGGSMAGLMAARVLSDHFSSVTVVERDRYPAHSDCRPGVPQASHVHVLLRRGQLILEDLFPGIREEYVRRGADFFDSAADFAWLTPAGWAPRFQCGWPFLAASRPLLEWVVRKQLERIPQIEFLQGAAAVGLCQDAVSRKITGVHLESRSGENVPSAIEADLTVDASGRSSLASDWLARLGYERPLETVVDGHMGYASRIYRRSGVPDTDWRASYSQAAPPAIRRIGLAFPIEEDRWIVSLAGGGGDYPPSEEKAFAAFAQSLPNPDIYRVITTSEPLSPIRSHRGTQNRLRHYENVKMPEGFVVMGDAACAFNPVYGQGMSTAAMGAQLLQECLYRRRLDRFQRELTRRLQPAWMFATSEDVRYPGAEGAAMNLSTRLMHRYFDGVLDRSLQDRKTRADFLQVLHMLRPPSLLFRPRVLLPVLWRLLARRLWEPSCETGNLAGEPVA
jgi:2-polyprenyl-6-methoxyphenol hydroxylase-like FAD-dependent oxidoreductase